MSAFDVKDVAVGNLHPWDRNPRTISKMAFDRLKRSMQEEPDMLRARPLIALPDGTVVAGNMRLRAAADLGWTTIPTVYADLDERRAAEWAVRDNNEFGEWHDDQLAELVYELQQQGSDLELLGFTDKEIDAMLASVGVGGPAEEDAVPEPPAEPITKPGDLWLLGEHRLLCGDSTKREDVERLMAGAKAAMVLADPPYNVDYRGGTHDKDGRILRERADAYEDVRGDYAEWVTAILAAAAATSETQAALHLWHSSSELRAILCALDKSGWVNRSTIIWDKGSIQGGIGQASKQYRTQCEPMFYCHKKGQVPYWYGPGNESDVWAEPGPKANPLHPTMKPIALYERSLANHTRRGEIVRECFGGSGTTLIAAHNLGRVAYLMEIDAGYCDVIVQRWENLTGKQATLEARP